MGTNLRVHTSHVQSKSRRNDGSRPASNGPAYRVSHQGDVTWALGPKTKRNYEGSMGQRAERCKPIRNIETSHREIKNSLSTPALQ